MENYFKDQVLKDIYTIRNDGFQCEYIKHFGTPNEINESLQAKEKLDKILKEYVKNKQDLEKIEENLEEFISAEIGELCFWMEQYYKLGFIDAMSLLREIRQPFFTPQKTDNDIFVKEMFNEWIENERYNVWNKKSEYKEILEKANEIKNKYSNLRGFYDDDMIKRLSEDEVKALNELMALDRKKVDIELIGCLKLGIKIGQAL